MTLEYAMSNSNNPKKGGKPGDSPKLSPNLSPVDAIAEAWKKESRENQEKWRREDFKVKHDYEARRRWKKDRAKM